MQKVQGLGETEAPPLEGTHKITDTKIQHKAVTPQEHGLDLRTSLGGSTRDVGAGCGSKRQGARTLVAEVLEDIDQHEVFLRSAFRHTSLILMYPEMGKPAH